MSSTTTTQYYGLTQYVGSDKPSFLDNNEAFAAVDAALHGAVTGVASQGEAISGLSSTVDALGETVTGLSNSLDAEKAKIVILQNKEITQDAAIAEVKADALDMICANNEEAATSTHAYSVGDFFRYNDVLYKATDTITIGATIVPNVNCEATNVSEELLELAPTAPTAAEVSYNNTSSGLTADDVQEAIDEVVTMVKYATPDVEYTPTAGMTNSQVLDALYALTDTTKLTPKSKITTDVGDVYQISFIESGSYRFGRISLNRLGTEVHFNCVTLKASGSVTNTTSIQGDGTVVFNDSSAGATGWTKLNLFY